MSRPVALVTAASRGMGAAIARRLAADGYRLALLSRSDDVHPLAEALGAVAVQGSVTSPQDLARLVDRAMARYGRVDAAACNTGHPPKGDLLALTDDDWHTGLDLVFLHTVRLARLVTPLMERQGGGAIVNISTFGAVEPSLAFPVSSALRAGLSAFVKLFAERYGPAGIRMNNVLPGFIETYPVDEATRAGIPLRRARDGWRRWPPPSRFSSRTRAPISPGRTSGWTAGSPTPSEPTRPFSARAAGRLRHGRAAR